MSQASNPVARVLRATFNGIDRTRRVVVNLLFLAILGSILYLALKNNLPEIEDGSALVIAPQGVLVEQLTGRSFEQALDEARGNATQETLLKDVLDAIAAARDDDRFPILVLDLNSFAGAGLTKLQDVAEALEDFRGSGKRVIAIADNYGMNSYYLAAHADEVLMNPLGMVAIEGLGRYRMFYREGLEKLGVDVNVFKVGTFKSAVEPFLLDGMSDEARMADQEWLGDLWRLYLEDVGEARGLGVEAIDRYAQDFATLMQQANGNTGQGALDYGLVDKLMTRVEMREYLVGMVGEDARSNSFRRTSMADLLATVEADRFGRQAGGDKVVVVVARGSILNGSHPPGTIGGDSTAALIRRARNDDSVKAIILRVDSGGGSAFASEVIRRELEAARADGIKVVASMGSVAASGGYLISTASDQIWAHPSTITGSIGIFALIPTYQKPLEEYLGVRLDGVTTAPLAGVRPDRALPQEFGQAKQLMIEQGYRDFLQRVADARGMSTAAVDEVAQGRVWSGEDALALGLVDNLGDLDDAVSAAAGLAGLGDDYTVTFVEKRMKWQQQLLQQMTARAMLTAGIEPTTPSPLRKLLGQLEDAAEEVARFNDPNHLYAWSSIETD